MFWRQSYGGLGLSLCSRFNVPWISTFAINSWVAYYELNYSSVITLYPEIIDGVSNFHNHSFVVDVPDGNTTKETCYFVEALIKCNLKSLADVSEQLTVQDHTNFLIQSVVDPAASSNGNELRRKSKISGMNGLANRCGEGGFSLGWSIHRAP
ncbi:ABA receptor [Tanacetum coccineum]